MMMRRLAIIVLGAMVDLLLRLRKTLINSLISAPVFCLLWWLWRNSLPTPDAWIGFGIAVFLCSDISPRAREQFINRIGRGVGGALFGADVRNEPNTPGA